LSNCHDPRIHPSSYIKKFLGSPTDLDSEELKKKHDDLQEEVARLQRENESLNKQVRPP
jgi:hypothetical protein